eukprot:472039-Amorphochlora_amoeboformis.AAC.1
MILGGFPIMRRFPHVLTRARASDLQLHLKVALQGGHTGSAHRVDNGGRCGIWKQERGIYRGN